MGKELTKFTDDYDKLQKACKGVNESAGKNIIQQYKVATANLTEGEKNLKSALTKARKAGVTADSFDDFMKNKDFKEAYGLLDKATDELEGLITSVGDLGEKSKAAGTKYAAIRTAIKADLAKRKDNSETKKDIVALDKIIDKRCDELDELSADLSSVVKPLYRDYKKNLQKTVTKIVKEAPDVVTKETEDNELPQQITDRRLATNFGKCNTAANDITKLCNSAIDKAGDGDSKGAESDLKEARGKYADLQDIADEYEDISKRYKRNIDISKDKNKINDTIEKIVDLAANAERTLRGTATTVKKASLKKEKA